MPEDTIDLKLYRVIIDNDPAFIKRAIEELNYFIELDELDKAYEMTSKIESVSIALLSIAHYLLLGYMKRPNELSD